MNNIGNIIILDIATLTGNVESITGGMGGIVQCNNKARKLKDKLVKIGLNIGEYLDYLQLREEYNLLLKSSVADIQNVNNDFKAGCIYAGTFLNKFCDKNIPWIHIDIGCTSFRDHFPKNFGVYLLYNFIKII